MSTDYQPTYWYHPESESFMVALNELEAEKMAEEGPIVQLDNEFSYSSRYIMNIDDDPSHTLPQNIVGVVKLAQYVHNKQTGKGYMNGELWYDQRKRFKDGHMIHSSGGTREPGGIFVSASGDRYLCEFVQSH